MSNYCLFSLQSHATKNEKFCHEEELATEALVLFCFFLCFLNCFEQRWRFQYVVPSQITGKFTSRCYSGYSLEYLKS